MRSYLKIWLKKSGGLIFVGKRTRIKYPHRISVGKTITIGDNGKGFDPGKTYQGNGLTNMRKRLEQSFGKLCDGNEIIAKSKR